MKKNSSTIMDRPVTITRRNGIVYALITLVGFNLRSVILAVPPILPLIQHDLALSYSAIGLLTALPVLVLAGTAWPSGLLIERIGGRACVAIGLALLGTGTLLRALLPSALSLYFFTLLLSLGIALAQTAVPVLARQWFPKHIGLVSALFGDGLIFGETIAAGITVPVMTHFLGRDAWTSTFVFWGIPVIGMLVLWLWLAPSARAIRSAQSEGASASTTSRSSSSPVPVRQRARVSALHLGIMIGAGSLVYFGMNGWIASYNQAMRHADLTPLALATLNAAQLPVSLGVNTFQISQKGEKKTKEVQNLTY